MMTKMMMMNEKKPLILGISLVYDLFSRRIRRSRGAEISKDHCLAKHCSAMVEYNFLRGLLLSRLIYTAVEHKNLVVAIIKPWR